MLYRSGQCRAVVAIVRCVDCCSSFSEIQSMDCGIEGHVIASSRHVTNSYASVSLNATVADRARPFSANDRVR